MAVGKKQNMRRVLRNIGLAVVGTALLALATAVFAVPYNLVIGGMSGIAIIVNRLAPGVSIDLCVTVLTWGLFLLGVMLLGKNFALKTLISTIVYPPCFALFSMLCSPDVLGGVFYMQDSQHSDIAILVASLFGGVLCGAGAALAFLGGGSTGGTDVIAFTLCKYFKKLRSSVVLFLLDASIILFGLFVIQDLVVTLLGILYAFVYALVVDKIFVGGQSALIAQIISNNCKEINQEVIKRLKRTTTFMEVTGGYTGEKKTMLIVSFTMRQYTELNGIISRCDPDAFVTVHRAHEINGEGWTR